MQPGEAIYVGPNEPHAYLSGGRHPMIHFRLSFMKFFTLMFDLKIVVIDCMECMACSDNVVRAGLTPKLKDVPTLIEMLTYNCEPTSAKRFQPCREDECTEVFRPPVPDFAVAKITVQLPHEM